MRSLFETVVARIRDDAGAGLLPGYLQTASIERSMTLQELGVDSLGRMALLTTLMDLTDKYMPDTAFAGEQTLGDIVDGASALASATGLDNAANVEP